MPTTTLIIIKICMYCHFYQLTGKCFKAEKCPFKHKDPVTYECLNQKKCPICNSGGGSRK